MDWNHLTTIEVRGHRVAIKDAMVLLDTDESSPEWQWVDLEPGSYAVEINILEPWHCARVRVYPDGSSPELGREIGRLSVDSGRAGIVDYESFRAEVRADVDAYEEWTATELADELEVNFSGQIPFGSTALAYVKSGDGDGSYPVFELREDGRPVGLECEFDQGT